MSRLVVDTDVASYIFKWHPAAAGYVRLLREHAADLSFMSVAEMWSGALHANWGTRRLDLLHQYLSDFTICYPDRSLCIIWAEVKLDSTRKGNPISAQDAWIAATAIYLEEPLLTNNHQHFLHVTGLELVRPTTA
jgi:tRNA(fMet)-specific endonuclease VapC